MVTIYALTATSSVFALKGCPLLQGRWRSDAWESLWLPLLWFRCVSGGPFVLSTSLPLDPVASEGGPLRFWGVIAIPGGGLFFKVSPSPLRLMGVA